MADYYPLIARAVAALDKNTGEARRALYERARAALVAQLRGATPALSESDITRERLGLEEAIRKVEAEAARRGRAEPPRGRPEPGAAPGPAPHAADHPGAGPSAQPGDMAGPAPEPDGEPIRPPRPRLKPGERPSSLTDQALRGFRDTIAEADDLGGATAQAGRSARAAYQAVPGPSPELDRLEPRMEPEVAPARRSEPPVARIPEAVVTRGEPRRAAPPPPPEDFDDDYADDEPPPRRPFAFGGLLKALAAVVLALVVAGLVWWQSPNIVALYQSLKGQPSQVARTAPPPQGTKIPDRVGPGGTPPSSAARPGAPPVAAVAQRVVLYEEDPNDPEGKRLVGSAIWRTETISPGPGLPPELAVRADVEIPERRMTMTWSIRRNTDQALPASHTIEVMFNLPADFPNGGISSVPGILMKQAEQTRGTPLSGLAVKVTTNFFLIGLSALDTDVQRNMQLLKERAWFDVPLVYTNGRRAILAMEKGNPGERSFSEAFAAWEGGRARGG